MNKKKTFNLLLIAQSLSAFGDNAVFSVIMGMLLGLVKTNQLTLIQFGFTSAIYANCLFLPYVVFAPILGWFSDRYTKKNVLIYGNLIKAFGCLIGLIGVIIGKNLMVASYLMIGIGAAVYSPSKYGIIPELKAEEDLVKANAAIEMTTIFSILIGIIGGSLLIDNLGEKNSYFVLTVVFFAAVFFNYLMDESHIRNTEAVITKSIVDFKISVRNIFTNRYLLIPVLGTAIFWFAASFLKLNLQTWGQEALKLSTATSLSLLALWLSLGIIVGSFIAGEKYKTGQIRQTWIFGLGMGLLILIMAAKYFNYGLVIVELILLGALGGIFLIPLNAAIQAKADLKNIGKVIAIQNFLENGAMLISSGCFYSLNKAAVSSIFTFISLGGFLCLINILWLRPSLKKL
ncbi:MAG: MFS transporter [Elusimicrobiota bacterium]